MTDTFTDDSCNLGCKAWKNTRAFSALSKKLTQVSHYTSNGASPEVMTLVEMTSKSFGTEAEKIIIEIFRLGKRTSSQNDGTCDGKKIEIKCARYWAGKDDCKWQHLEPDHDYDVAMFALLDFHGWKVWAIKKSVLMGPLRESGVVTYQGKQGWWAEKSALLPYLTPIETIAQLRAFVQ